MSKIACRAALMGVSVLVLAACAAGPGDMAMTMDSPAAAEPDPVPAAQAPVRDSTAFTLGTDQPRAPEQLAVKSSTATASRFPPVAGRTPKAG